MLKPIQFLLFFILIPILLHAQTPDTIVVYEYEYVTDTVWIEEEADEQEALLIDRLEPQNQNCFLETNATISENGIYKDANQNQPKMKKIAFLGLTMIVLSSTLIAQNDIERNWSIFLKGNLAGLIYDDLMPKFIDESNTLVVDNGEIRPVEDDDWIEMITSTPAPLLGFGFAYKMKINQFLTIEPKLQYIQKGSRFKNSKSSPAYTNKFHYISSDLVLKIGKTTNLKSSFSFYTGLRGDLRVGQHLEYDIVGHRWNIDDNSYESYIEFDDYNRFNWGIVNGVGFEKWNSWYIQLEMNNDLGYLTNEAELKVKNYVLSLNIGLYLNKIPKYKLVKKD